MPATSAAPAAPPATSTAAEEEAAPLVLTELPHELLLHAASFANSAELNSLLRTCRTLRELKDDAELRVKWLATQYPEQALHKALDLQDEQLFLQLLAMPGVRADAKERGSNGDTPLPLASQRGWVQAVGALLAGRGDGKEVDVNCRNRWGKIALHLAMNCEDEAAGLQCARLLLGAGADVGAESGGGVTPLHYAACNGHGRIAELLLEQNGCDANAGAGADGGTPLHLAAFSGQVDMVRMLLGHDSVDANARTRAGCTPLQYALRGGQLEVVRLLSEDYEELMEMVGMEMQGQAYDAWE